MVEDAFLTQIVTQPTRKKNILDLAFTSDPDLVRDLKVGEKLGGSEHHLIRFNVKTKYTLADNETKIPDYQKANFNRACQLTSPGATWNQLNFTHADTAWMGFKNKLLEVERATVPMKTRRVNGTLNLLWMTTDVKRAINSMKKKITI